jgi:hypothetical protein
MYDLFFEEPLKKMIEEEFALKGLSNISSKTSPEYLKEVEKLL